MLNNDFELISVIVPIYNVEEYLPRCIDSILNQTYKNLEIILVNDGSPDNCGEICDEYAKKDSRIRVIHKKNGGLSDARNHGIDVAKGEFICFIDSDDYINPNMIEILYTNLKKTKSDLSICMYEIVKGDEHSDTDLNNQDIKIYTKNECFGNLFNELSVPTIVAWNKLYKKDIWKNLRYPVGKVNEDEFVIHYVINECNSVVYTNLKLHYYFCRENSIMNTFNEKRLACIDAFKDRVEFFKKKNINDLYEKSIISYLNCISDCYINCKKCLNKDKNLLNKISLMFKDEYKRYKNIIKISIKKKIKYFLIFHMFYVYSLVENLLYKK